MMLAHRIALEPNNVQAMYLSRAAGTARFAYNWALAEWKRQYETWKLDNTQPKPTQQSLRRRLNSIKREQFPWMLEVTKNAPQMFRRKGIHDRFTLTNDQFSVEGRRIRIPNLGWVRMREPLRFTGKIMSATVSRVADKWYVSIGVDVTDNSHLPEAENQGAVGVDLGVSALATLSTGEIITGPKPHKALLGRLRRLSRRLSRKKKGSNNRNKAKVKLSKLHAQVACIRNDALHKLTTDLTRRFHTIVIEDLNIKGMVKNRHLARSIADMGFFELRRQLSYKADQRGGQIIVADRWFASSKTCSACGHKLDVLPLSVRHWTCPACGGAHGRDVNAAINLKNLAVSSTVSACGEESAGSGRKPRVKLSSMKQEVNSISV